MLDTNLWISRSYLSLNTPLSAAFLYALGQKKGTLGMPEVLEREIRKHLTSFAIEQAGKFSEASSALEDLGIYTSDEPPFSQSGLRDIAESRLDSLTEFLLRVPLTENHARRALERIEAEQPPNGPKNQQFKDSAIWEAVLELGREHNVIFVTGDKMFFKDREASHGLADNLRRDSQALGLSVTVISSDALATVITELQEGVPRLDEARVLMLLRPEVERTVREQTGHLLRSLGRGLGEETSAYLTGTPGVLAVTYEFAFQVTGGQEEEPEAHGQLRVEGSCEYRPDQDKIDHVTVVRFTAYWDGTGQQPAAAETWGPDVMASLRGERARPIALPIPWMRMEPTEPSRGANSC